jgi:Domain of unknown function (DUF4386)
MTLTAPTAVRMDPDRRTALVAGLFYLLTFVSIPSLALYGAIHDPSYVLGPGTDSDVRWAAVLEVVVALAGIGTAVTLFRVVKRQNESMALGFVATRVLEAGLILVGVASVLSVVTLRQNPAGADPASLVAAGKSLMASYDNAFLLGQSLMPPLNALLLGTLLYRSRLVPRALPLLGLIGAPLQIASVLAVMFGVYDRISAIALVAAIPIALWEFSLGVWLVVRGFRTSAIDEHRAH